MVHQILLVRYCLLNYICQTQTSAPLGRAHRTAGDFIFLARHSCLRLRLRLTILHALGLRHRVFKDFFMFNPHLAK